MIASPIKRALAAICSAIAVLALASCNSCEYVSDTAKEASKTAHSEIDKRLDEETVWHASAQEADGRRLVETGTVSYGCRTYVTPHTIHVGKSTIITTTSHTSCEHEGIEYRLVYDMSGNVIDFVRN